MTVQSLLKKIDDVMNKLNNQPRICLGFKIPIEAFFGIKTNITITT